jgi:riboflavin kinase / FMN adenylyltransferase
MNTLPVQKIVPPFTWSGRVINGEKVGRTLGFPTANLDTIPEEADLKPGVYLGSCRFNHQTIPQLSCLTYFGPRYVFGEEQNCFEVFIYDFNAELYDQELEVDLEYFLREPMNLNSLDALKTQLEEDKQLGRSILNP